MRTASLMRIGKCKLLVERKTVVIWDILMRLYQRREGSMVCAVNLLSVGQWSMLHRSYLWLMAFVKAISCMSGHWRFVCSLDCSWRNDQCLYSTTILAVAYALLSPRGSRRQCMSGYSRSYAFRTVYSVWSCWVCYTGLNSDWVHLLKNIVPQMVYDDFVCWLVLHTSFMVIVYQSQTHLNGNDECTKKVHT